MSLGIIVFLLCVFCCGGDAHKFIMTTDEFDNHICAEDLEEFQKASNFDSTTTTGPPDPDYWDYISAEDTKGPAVPNVVDCFGLGSLTRKLPWLFNMQPDSADVVNTHFFFSSRNLTRRLQVYAGSQFGLEFVDFNPKRKTILIVHGFMSHSNASWVTDMTRAFLEWGDVNVITADWSGGGNTWKYWRAVANTRRVGSEITKFMDQLMQATGAVPKDFHFVGHSLGAHICSYVSFHLGGVHRITGLDPAQPCFHTKNRTEKLDETDADFVDIIHTNGRLLRKIGFGLPDPAGDADFYPNGGMKQPGCFNKTNSVWSKLLPISPTKLQQAICSHGRAYLLFTESLINNNCTFRGHRWNLSYDGVNASLAAVCDRKASCSAMGIQAIGENGSPKAKGPYFVLTTEKEPYCPTEWELRHPRADLLMDLQAGFRLDRSIKHKLEKVPSHSVGYADPDGDDPDNAAGTTTCKSWLKRWFG